MPNLRRLTNATGVALLSFIVVVPPALPESQTQSESKTPKTAAVMRLDEERAPSAVKESTITFGDVWLLAEPQRRGGTKYAEISEWKEVGRSLWPSARFDVVCQISTMKASHDGDDFFGWTTIDFLVAPVTEEFERKSQEQLANDVSWGQIREMRDLKVVPLVHLKAGDSRHVVLKGFDLTDVIAAFPGARDSDNLWPWLMRLNVNIQDRSGKLVGSVQKTFSLKPNRNRIPAH